MPSPFPGMDPFLEHPSLFPDLHGALHVYIREALQRVLPSPYFSVVSERLWVETTYRYIEPDTDVIHGGRYQPDLSEGGTAVAVETRSPPLMFEVEDDEHRESFVEIRSRRENEGERVVTTIEVLSPANKTEGEKGRQKYLEKQAELLASDVHLIEIDLLRHGEHTTPTSLERIRRKAGKFDYHVSVHRFNMAKRFFIYAWRLEDMLPEISVPLLPGDRDVALDLQTVFDRCYDTGPYRRRVRYDTSRIVPPLSEDRVAWVNARLSQSELAT